MSDTTAKSAFLSGVMAGLPFVLVIIPFALLFGVVATEAGLNLVETMGFSVFVVAGASQFAAVQMMVDDAATWLVIAASLAVNLRMAMYSASLVPWLAPAPVWKRALVAYLTVDQAYAASIAAYQSREMTVSQRVAYFFGVAAPVVPLWYAFTLVGAIAGARVPDALALDFALPITFIAMLGPLLRTLPQVTAAAVSVAVSLALAGLPSGFGLLIAAMAAMCAGALVEVWQERADG